MQSIKVLFFKCFLFLTRGLPLPLLHRIARLWSQVLYRIPNRSRETSLANLRLCYPEADQSTLGGLVLKSLEHTACTAMEMGKTWSLPMATTLAMVKEYEGLEEFEAATAAGTGVILLAPHMGNWELFAFSLCDNKKATWLYQPPKIGALDALMVEARSRAGIRMVPTTPAGVGELLKALRRGEIAGILPDQVPGQESGRFAPFLGQQAYTMTLVSKLLQRTEAQAFCGLAMRLPHSRGFKTIVMRADNAVHEADIQKSLTGLNHSVARCLAFDIPQYQWEYKRFRRRPDAREIYSH